MAFLHNSLIISAERGSRTPTPLRTHAPETCHEWFYLNPLYYKTLIINEITFQITPDKYI